MIARNVCLHAGLIAVMSACLVTNGTGETSGLGISDDAAVDFIWTPNSESDMAGYKVYIGTLSGIYGGYVDVGLATSFQQQNLIRGMTYYFALTAYNTNGSESDFTPELAKQIPLLGTTVPFAIDPGLTNSPPSTDPLDATNAGALPEPLLLEILWIPDQVVLKNGIPDPIPFKVSGSQTPDKLEVVAVSFNPSLLPPNGVILAGAGRDYILIMNPTNGRKSTAVVTIAASDGQASTSVSFQVTIGNADEARSEGLLQESGVVLWPPLISD